MSFNPCADPKPRIEISFFLLSICTNELLSTPTIATLLPTLPSGHENSERESNPIPEPVYTCSSGSEFLANLEPPNKQSYKVKSEFKSRDHVPNL